MTARLALLRAVCALSFLPLLPAQVPTLTLGAPFGDHMVLQRDLPVTLWGRTIAHSEVAAELDSVTTATRSDDQGHFRVTLPPHAAGGPFALTLTVTPSDGSTARITLTDVLVGEVWLCSGQSNMEFPVSRANDAEHEIATADFPSIRLLTVERAPADHPLGTITGTWQPCTPSTVGDFSAVGYFFGRALRQDLDVPIGLIDSTWGGSTAEAWMSPDQLAACGLAEPIAQRWARLEGDYHAANTAWEQASASPSAAGKPPRRPSPPPVQHHPSVLWNGMIAPLVPLSMRGVIWYQGESNADRAAQYQSLFQGLITGWRQAWGREMPFLFVQLASFGGGDSIAWAELRDAQTAALALPHTGMVVTTDVGNATDIHPRNKQEVGRRLALVARRQIYGEDDVFDRGPRFRSQHVEGDSIRIDFADVDGGLESASGSLLGFEVAGEDGVYHPAQARIDGETVVVHSDDVPEPRTVRYAWVGDAGPASLRNHEGLPACPFRTDELPLKTASGR